VITGTWPEDYRGPIAIRGYQGDTYEELIEAFHKDALLMLEQGFEPAGQHYVAGEWTVSRAVAATILLPFLIGFLFWAQMLVHQPIGSLTVTYVHRDRGNA
jgi:hypothetical protein